MDKREFLLKSFYGTGGLLFAGPMLMSLQGNAPGLNKWSKESMFYAVTPRGTKCLVCPNECTLKPGETSTCHNRVNIGGKLYSIAYGNPCAVHVDPVEKKPLLHFLPGTYAYSIATAGCNLACLNCQNWTISQKSPSETQNADLMPPEVVRQALANGCHSIAYTYSEPVSFYEYVYDTSVIAHERGLKNLFISNGYINTDPLKKMCTVIDAANINLKSFSDDIYLRLNAGKLQPVLNTLKTMRDQGVWLEITNLVIPSWTDNFDMIKRMCNWIVSNGFSNYPLHFIRFHPMYKLTQLPATPYNILVEARKIAMAEGCHYVYIGNAPGTQAENTLCPGCHAVVVERKGFHTLSSGLAGGKCRNCGTAINGVWK